MPPSAPGPPSTPRVDRHPATNGSPEDSLQTEAPLPRSPVTPRIRNSSAPNSSAPASQTAQMLSIEEGVTDKIERKDHGEAASVQSGGSTIFEEVIDEGSSRNFQQSSISLYEEETVVDDDYPQSSYEEEVLESDHFVEEIFDDETFEEVVEDDQAAAHSIPSEISYQDVEVCDDKGYSQMISVMEPIEEADPIDETSTRDDDFQSSNATNIPLHTAMLSPSSRPVSDAEASSPESFCTAEQENEALTSFEPMVIELTEMETRPVNNHEPQPSIRQIPSESSKTNRIDAQISQSLQSSVEAENDPPSDHRRSLPRTGHASRAGEPSAEGTFQSQQKDLATSRSTGDRAETMTQSSEYTETTPRIKNCGVDIDEGDDDGEDLETSEDKLVLGVSAAAPLIVELGRQPDDNDTNMVHPSQQNSEDEIIVEEINSDGLIFEEYNSGVGDEEEIIFEKIEPDEAEGRHQEAALINAHTDESDYKDGPEDEDKENDTWKLARRKRCFWIIYLLSILLIAVGLTLLILLLKNKGDVPSLAQLPNGPPRYEVLNGPYTGDPSTGFGGSVSLDGDLLVVGLPAMESGEMRSYTLKETDFSLPFSQISGREDGSGFGWSVDVAGTVAIIGAPFLLIEDTPTPAGGVFVYSISDSTWSQMGTTLRGDEDLTAANEGFGWSVSVAATETFYRVIIGAPLSNLNAFEIGRVYTFEKSLRNGTSWIRMESEPLIGERSGGLFGSSVAMSKDGTTFIAGSPGGDLHDDPGTAFVYKYTGFDWDLVFAFGGFGNNERLGASVAILSDDGNTFAIGAPNYQGGSGRVIVFRKSANGLFGQVGTEIVGESGEKIGERNLIGGSVSDTGVQVVIATAYGRVRRYDYLERSGNWSTIFEELDPGFDSVSSISVSGSGASSIAVASKSDGRVAVYGPTLEIEEQTGPLAPSQPLVSPIPPPVTKATSPPMTAPTPSPTFDNLYDWNIVGGPFTEILSQSGYGNSIAISISLMAVGAPFSDTVFTYSREGNGDWSYFQEIAGPDDSSSFGYSLDTDGEGLLVGAPSTSGGGAAYYYEFANNQASLLGDPLRGSDTGGFFGSSVAISSNRVAVVGDSGHSVASASRTGAFYIFEYANVWSLQAFEIGFEGGDGLGHAVDIDSSGSLVVVGAPDRNGGYAMVYAKAGSIWEPVLFASGEQSGDAFGKSVKVLSPDYVAVGAPGFQQGRGRVTVYERNGDGFQEMADIIGEEGDRIGSSLKLGGSGTAIVVGKANGEVQRFDFDSATLKWIQIVKTIDTGLGSGLTALATPPDSSGTLAIGGKEKANVYTLK